MLGDCDDNGSCETELSVDADNCGACDRGCLGASCAAGQCQPIQLRAGQDFPHYLVVDSDHVFWTTGGQDMGNGTVMRVNKDGTGPRTLVDDGLKPRGIAVDDSFIYWSDGVDGALHRIPKTADGSGQDQVLVPGQAMTESGEGFVLLDGGRAYWSHGQAGSIRSATLGGADVTEHVSGQPGPTQCAILDGTLYFTVTEPELRRVPLAGGMVEVLANPDNRLPNTHVTFGIVVLDGGLVYRESDYGAGLNGRVMRFMPGRDIFSVLVDSAGARDIAADATHLFWASEDVGTLSRARRDGSEAIPLAVGQEDPTGVAVDAEALYWTNRSIGVPGGGAVLKVAK
jgi:hypothetical protein